MRIVWHGHACFEIEDTATIVTDPHDGKSIGIKAPVVKADIVMVSHDHFDHNSVRVVKGNFVTVTEPGHREIKGVEIDGIETYHDEEGGAKRGANILYRFHMNGITYCHCGDLGHLLDKEQIESLGDIDVLFIPVGGVFTIDGDKARNVVSDIDPGIAIPMHFRLGGLSLSVQTVENFLDGLPKERILRVGNEVQVYPEDLPEKTEYWVFSP